MSEKVIIREDLQIIQVESTGDVSYEDLKESLNEVLNIRQGRGLVKVFVNATKVTSIPSTFPVFQFGSELADATRGMRLAIATAPETCSDSIFMETVSVNRDLQFKVFDSADTALVWLMERPNKTDIGNGK